MNRYRAYWPLDDAPLREGDAGFVGVNAREHPRTLGPGWVSEAVNTRFDGGRAQMRKGVRVLPWSNRTPYGGQPDRIRGYGVVHGATVFADQKWSVEWLVVASQDESGRLEVWRSRPGNGAARVPVPDTPAGPVYFVQTLDGLVMLRGEGLEPLWMTSLDEGFRVRPLPDLTRYTALPEGRQGIYFQNRLLVVTAGRAPEQQDTIWVSDIGATEATLRGPADWWNNFRVNPGTSDRLVAVYPLTESSVLVLKSRSVHVLSNLVGTLSEIAAKATLQTVTDEYGAAASRAVVQVGRDVWFLSPLRGICSVLLTEQGKAQAVDLPVSRPLDPVIRRIHWPAAAGACAVFWNNRVYWSVPLDGSPRNNAVLVYDTLNQSWSGYDEGPGVAVAAWLKAMWHGEERLFCVTHDGVIGLYEDGAWDEKVDEEGRVERHPIRWRVTSRAYGGEDPGRKHAGRLRVDLESWWPRVQVSVITGSDRKPVTVRSWIERDRTRWQIAGRARYDATNAAGGHGLDGREDYSVTLPVWVKDGLQVDRMTAWKGEWPVRQQCQWLQVRLEADQGRVRWLGAEQEFRRGGVNYGAGE